MFEDAVQHETEIRWHDDPARYPYLRQQIMGHTSRSRVIGAGDRWSLGKRIVGYAVLGPKSPPGRFDRRIFWCKMVDRDGSREDPPYNEAVDPRLIRAGVVCPWLFGYSVPLEDCASWLAARRKEMGLAEGERAAAAPPKRVPPMTRQSSVSPGVARLTSQRGAR
jgi:hypothetical protein